MDFPDGGLDEKTIVDSRLHHLKTKEERDVGKLLKQLHEKNIIAFPFNLSESEPILTQDMSQMMDTLELDHSQQTNSSVFSGPVLPQDLLDSADFDELILECNKDTLSPCLNQENLNSISQALIKLEECTGSDESKDVTQEHEKPAPRPHLTQTFTSNNNNSSSSSSSKSSPKRDNLEDIRDFVDEYWTMKSRESFST